MFLALEPTKGCAAFVTASQPLHDHAGDVLAIVAFKLLTDDRHGAPATRLVWRVRLAEKTVCYAAWNTAGRPRGIAELAGKIGPEFITVCLDFDDSMRMRRHAHAVSP